MLIDWFTVGAQVLNFLVLVGLLRIFLYRRVIDAMDRREERIASRLSAAESKNAEAERKAEEYRRERERLEEEREQVLRRARDEAEEKRRERLAEAREEVEQSRRQWSRTLRREKDAFLRELRSRAARESIHLTREILEDMADTSLESRMAASLTARLRELDEEGTEALAGALREDGARIVVRSAFELPDPARESLREVLREWKGAEEPAIEQTGSGEATGQQPSAVDFVVERELICGIELEVGGQKIGWSIDDHLGRIEEEFAMLLDEESGRLMRGRNGGGGADRAAGTHGEEGGSGDGDD